MASTDDVITQTSSRAVAARLARREWTLLIGGRPVAGAAGGWATISPSTGEHVVTVPAARVEDVDTAVAAARDASEFWRNLAPRDRARRVRAWADLVAEHADELAELDAIDAGLPLPAARRDVAIAVEAMHASADWALALTGQTIPATADHLHYTVREPYGVVGRIVAYNHPLMFSARAAGPLVAGNAVIVKTPDQAPLSGFLLAELAAEAFPPGLVAVLPGAGSVVGNAMARHPAIRRLAFTGSVRTALTIQASAAAAGSIKALSFELGGKNPMIVYPDADLDQAAAAAVRGMNLAQSSGQSCGSTSRLVAHTSIAEELIERVRTHFQALVLGDPFAKDTQMGPVISESHRDRIVAAIEQARQQGARIVTGGGIPDAPAQGWYVEPTLLSGVHSSMSIASEEVFGPVLSVIAWDDESEALRIANDVSYGLTASVWTRDVARAHRVAAAIDAGFIWINETATHFHGVPFGGFKNSGGGREEDLSELLSYTQVKSVNVPLTV